MAVSANVLRVSTTLRLGERVLVRCDDGLLVTEYVLFDSTDIVLRATDPVTVRETGYITTARDALERLARASVTPALAEDAARSMPNEVIGTFGRSGALGSIAPRLGACELFDGAVYRASNQTYEGAWLDLRSLAEALGRGRVSSALQALHLAAALSEVNPNTPLHLSTANATRDRRPGERTHRRVPLDGVSDLPDALRRLTPNPRHGNTDAQRDRLIRDALLARVRERGSADAAPQLREHLASLEGALAAAETRPVGPLSDPELWAIEKQLATGDADGVPQRLDELERSQGSTAALRYLRARAALVGGAAPPSSVAQTLSVLANEDRNFHEAELGAARAWLAAGEDASARHFARWLAEDASASESERVVALEILDATSSSMRSQAPPPVGPRDVTAPSDGVVHAAVLVGADDLPHLPPVESAGPPGPPPPGASLPPVMTVPPPAREPRDGAQADRTVAGRARYEPELVEALALPMGATEEVLAIGDWPTTAIQARTAMTRLARSLARDYRLWYGATLRCNVLAVDAMQRHLAQRYAGATLDDPTVDSELQRHGARLSESLARRLGAEWVDIAPTEPGYWAMFVAPSTRCWPIGRVYRFVSLGHRERDLVSYFLDVEARTRR